MSYRLLTLLLVSSVAQAAPLTFRLNMQGQALAAGGPHVAGSFQQAAGYAANWNPATAALLDPDGDRVYELTVDVPPGTYLYKFVNGSTWAGAEPLTSACALDDGGGNLNRQLSLGASGLRLPAVAFGGCLPQVRLAVNMQGQAVAAAGVHAMGSFQALAGYGADWNPASLPLTDPDGDGIYEALVGLPAPGRFQYKFVNGSTGAGAETVPAACASPDATGGTSRVLDATSEGLSAPPAVCFGQCAPCGAAAPGTDYATHWWNDAVFYEIFVRSFQDSNGDGIGDFRGMSARLDYLNDGDPATTTDLGITGIWLMPMMESPSYHGYDVTNYLATEPDYGTMADFEAFLAAAHARGIKVIIDLVLNHSSAQHPWFQQSASGPTSPYRDYYRWSTTNPGQTRPWGPEPAWHPRNASYYYGIFYDGMPDLNWENPALKAAMWDATRFWLNKGVDGYRLDAVKYLNETGAAQENTAATLATLQEFGQVVRAARPAAFTVGEAWSPTPQVVPYVQNGRLDACFEFDLAGAIISALNTGNPAGLSAKLNQVANAYPKLQYATFLANHDQDRILGLLGGDLGRQRQAAALYLTMPGVPFLYYGEEIGQLGSGPDEEKRKPMQWSAGAAAGFSTGTPWRAPGANYATANVATQAADPASLLSHYKKLIQLRNASEPLRKGYLLPLTAAAPAGLVLYGRVFGAEATLTIANVGRTELAAPTLAVAVSTLPAGTYQATDLYSGQAAGTVRVDAQGAFSGWRPALGALPAGQTWILQLRPSQPTATTPARNAPALSLYPNPAATQVRVALGAASSSAAQLSVFDAAGRRVHRASFAGREHLLDVRGWAPGLYFVRVQTVTGSTVQRLAVGQ